jgi:hypothetical protein
VKRQKAVTRGHAREETILEDKHMRKNILTLYTSWPQRIQFNYQPPPTSTEDPPFEFLTTKKNSDVCSKAVGYISWEETFSFFNQSSRPSNFLFQISKRLGGLHSMSAIFLWKITCHLKDFFKIRSLQGFTSKEPGMKEVFEFNHEMLGGCRYGTRRVP